MLAKLANEMHEPVGPSYREVNLLGSHAKELKARYVHKSHLASIC